MLTSSHLYWTWRLLPRSPRRPQWIIGAALPDGPALALGGCLLLRGVARRELAARVYGGSARRRVHKGSHSVLATVAIATTACRARPVALGMFGHQIVDYATHADDAWAPLWPLSARRWKAPISYWQPEHHARAFAAVEAAALLIAVVTDGLTSRSIGGLGALALALGPLLREHTYSATIRGNIDWARY